jgi:hypothetical protein
LFYAVILSAAKDPRISHLLLPVLNVKVKPSVASQFLRRQIVLTRPAILLRIEDATLLAAVLFAYQHLHYSWLLFAILFLAPDLFMFGYLINPRLGATTYNLVHNLALPIALLIAGYLQHWQNAPAIALIWIAHIALDRLLGYGLKYPTFFKDTHLQHI